jgi:hypothetical protein
MPWEDDLVVVVKRTGVKRYEYLCSEAYFDHKRMRAQITEMAHEHEFPSLATQAGNLAGAIGRAAGQFLSGGPVLVPPEERDKRWAQCMTCENLVNDRCNLCGCFFAKKIRLAQESCPDKPPRWGAWNGDANHGS